MNSSEIYVNFFIAGENDLVEFRIGGQEAKWKRMRRVKEADPIYLNRLYRWDYTDELMPGRRPSRASISTHLWKATIPVGLPVGEHVIEVRATDMFGRTFTQQKPLRVALPAAY